MSLRDTDLYDEDTDTLYRDDNTYCKHGTYIGTPGGPDLLCHWCESGDEVDSRTDDELRADIAALSTQVEEYTAHLEHVILFAGPQAAVSARMESGETVIGWIMRPLFSEIEWCRTVLRWRQGA